MHACILSLVVPCVSPNSTPLCWVLTIGTPYGVYLGVGDTNRAWRGIYCPLEMFTFQMAAAVVEPMLTLELVTWIGRVHTASWLVILHSLIVHYVWHIRAFCVQVHMRPKFSKFASGALSLLQNCFIGHSRLLQNTLPHVFNTQDHFLQQCSSSLAYSPIQNSPTSSSQSSRCLPNILSPDVQTSSLAAAVDRSSHYHLLQNQLLEAWLKTPSFLGLRLPRYGHNGCRATSID